MRNKLAVVLDLAEDASRLSPLTNHRPVAALPFAGRYRIIDFIFSSLFNAEISSAALFIAGSGHALYDHIRSGSVWGLDSHVGGGVFTHSQIEYKLGQKESDNEAFDYYNNHRKYISKSNADNVLISGTQVLSNVNLDGFLQYHLEKGAKVTGAFKNARPEYIPENTVMNRYNFNQTQSEYIEEILPISEEDRNVERISAGLKMAIVTAEFMMAFLDFAEKNRIQVSAENVMKYALEEKEKVSAFEYTGYMRSIEDLTTYYEANMDMLLEPHFSSLFFRNGKVVTRPHHSAPNYFGPDSKVSNSQVASGSNFYGSVHDSIVFRNVDIGEGTEIKSSIVMSHSTIGKNVKMEYVISDKDVIIEDGVELKGTRENPLIIKKGEVVKRQSAQQI